MRVVIEKQTIDPPDALPFGYLPDGAVFRLDTGKAVYMKVKLRHTKTAEGAAIYKMIELATGHAFDPSKSDCLLLDAHVEVKDW
jgi:hypothetical protein